MRSRRSVLFCAVDDLIPLPGKPLTGFVEFLEGLSEAEIACVWITDRSRQQLEPAIRKLGHTGPFIAEGGSGVYLPEDYFHLKPAKTVRFGRFTCIPIAEPQPAAREALDALREESGVELVSLRSLSARELMQNTGLLRQDVEGLRHRDFDELFFFAGASEADIARVRERAKALGFALRHRSMIWSLSVGAKAEKCIKELRNLYDRALHAHVFFIGLTTIGEAPEALGACDRGIVLTDRDTSSRAALAAYKRVPTFLPLFSPKTWEEALRTVLER